MTRLHLTIEESKQLFPFVEWDSLEEVSNLDTLKKNLKAYAVNLKGTMPSDLKYTCANGISFNVPDAWLDKQGNIKQSKVQVIKDLKCGKAVLA